MAKTKEAPNLPSSESSDSNSTPGMVCISSTTVSVPCRRLSGSRSCSRITESIRLSSEAPTSPATSRPTAPWAVETSRMPPSRMVRRRSMAERD